jgi:hypothetical protein
MFRPNRCLAFRSDPLTLAGGSIVAALYSTSFFFPACDGSLSVSGWQAFTSIGEAVLHILPRLWRQFGDGDLLSSACWVMAAWWPNPLLWLGLVALLISRYRVAAAAGGVALFNCLYLLGSDWAFITMPEMHFGTGSYLWVASIALLTTVATSRAAWEGRFRPHQRRPSQ